MAIVINDKDLKSWAETLIDPKSLQQQGYLNVDVVWSMWRDLQERNIWRPQIWYVLMFQQWYMDEYRRG